MPAASLERSQINFQTSAGSPSESLQRARRFYRPELDFLRFGAFTCVFMTHAMPSVTGSAIALNGTSATRWLQFLGESGNFGVCLFFVLSAFLITEIVRREWNTRGTFSLSRFYLRRILRIWPLYLVVVLGGAAAGLAIPELHMSREQLMAYLLFAGNWYLILVPAGSNALSWLWTISVEEQFYILWPLLAKLAGVRSILWASILCLPLSNLAIILASQSGSRLYATVWLNSFVQFEFFALGAGIAIALSGNIPRLSTFIRGALVLTGAFLWFAASAFCLIKDPRSTPTAAMMCSGYALVAAGCGAFLIAALGLTATRIPKQFLYLGRISYGLYVFHGLALQATTSIRWKIEVDHHSHGVLGVLYFCADRACALALTIACAALSYKFLESPFLRMNQRLAAIKTRLA